MNYLEENHEYWSAGYHAPNPESIVFRFMDRILEQDFQLPKAHSRLLDFGCGQGAHVDFFLKQGFDARGVDISKRDIEFGRIRYPHLGGRLQTCESAPDANSYYGWENGIDVVIASQSLYYLSEADFQKTLTKLYDAMAPGGIIFASMMGTDHTYYKHSEPTDDSSLRKVNFEGTRFSVHNYVSFTESAEALQKRFLIFDKVRTGQYMMELEEGESNNFHWVFIGQKNS